MTDYFTANLKLSDPLTSHRRGFLSLADHDDSVLSRIASVLKPRDRLYILGNVTGPMGTDDPAERLAPVRDFLTDNQITGHLILGDCDAAHPSHKNCFHYYRSYADVFTSINLTAPVVVGGVHCLLNHHIYFDGPFSPVTVPGIYEHPLITGMPTDGPDVPVIPDTFPPQISVDIDVNGTGPVSKDQLSSRLNDIYARRTRAALEQTL